MYNFKNIALLILFAFLLIANAIYAYGTDEQLTFTIESKERIVDSEGSSKYLIFTDKGVFENTDSIFYWKWNSSDIYGNLKEGSTYSAHVYGFRFGFLSIYKNIIEIAEESR